MKSVWGGAALLALAAVQPAAAQGQAIIQPGYGVVTGFSGTVESEPPAGADPTDYLMINYDGPSARVVDLTAMAGEGDLTDATKIYDISAAQVGQVFGVALDDAESPNIYLAATSAYGVSIQIADSQGRVRRLHAGAPGASFAYGQWGPADQGGGPGSIWRVDGETGEVSLFANIDNAASGVAALGGLAFDPKSQQLFAVERGTGLIHRFSLDGTDRGVYDHGTEGRPAAGLAPMPLPPPLPVNIQSPTFSPEKPASWRYAAPGRRVFGLAVRNGRLYYSVAQGPQIWSVGIAPNGALSVGPRLETDVPALQSGVEIASIAFDARGRLYAAERAAPTGDFALRSFADSGVARVLRFTPKDPGDPTPGLWSAEPEQYSVGMPPNYENASGGVALSYGFQPNGQIDPGSCRTTVWSTGERLLDPGDPQNYPPGSYQTVDGLQGNGIDMVQPENMPPTSAYFVDYDDQSGDPEASGQVGAVAIHAPCAGKPVPPAPPPPPPPSSYCPPGTYFDGDTCLIIPSCPPDTIYRNGLCVYPSCPPGYVEWKGACVPPPQFCPPGSFFYKGECLPIHCPPGMKKLPNGYCVCPPENIFFGGKCVPPKFCPPGMVELPGGICWCPLGKEMKGGKCVPVFCPPGWGKLPNGKCVPGGIFPGCPIGQKLIGGKCFPVCKPFEKLIDGKCVMFPIGPKPGFCKPNEKLINGKCVPFPIGPKEPGCLPNQKLINGKCVPFPIGPKEPGCLPNQKLINGKCLPLPVGPKEPVCKPNEKLIDGNCVKLEIGPIQPHCGPNEKLINGKCLPDFKKPNDRIKLPEEGPKLPKLEREGPKVVECPEGQAFINGRCRPQFIQPQGELKQRDKGPKIFNEQPQGNQNGVDQPRLKKGKSPEECHEGEVLIRGKCRPAPQ